MVATLYSPAPIDKEVGARVHNKSCAMLAADVTVGMMKDHDDIQYTHYYTTLANHHL